MAHNVEKVSVWILEALEDEWRREPDILKCRTCEIVLGEVMAKNSLENEEITKAIKFMLSPVRQYLKIIDRPDGKAILPSDAGLEKIAEIHLHRINEAKAEATAKKAEIERQQDVRLKKYQIIISILGLVIGCLGLLVAYLAHKLWR